VAATRWSDRCGGVDTDAGNWEVGHLEAEMAQEDMES
jgi:hypothetical protein